MFLPIQASPYLRLFKRLFLGQGSLQAISYKQEIIFPEEKATLRPPLFLSGQLDRVEAPKLTDSRFVTTKESEIAAMTSTMIVHPPTIAYHIKDAVLFNGAIYVGNFKHPIAEKSLFDSNTHRPYRIKACALASTYLGTKYFGHWLADDCTKYMLASEFGNPLCLRMPASTFGHRQEYQTYFAQDWTSTDRARIDHLVVFQDFSQNSLKRKRYKFLRDRIKAHFPQSGHDTYVYLRRGKTGVVRTIQNEDEIIDALVKRGFLVVDITSDSLDFIIESLLNAKIVVSLEGSHLAHWIYTSPEPGGLLVLQPPDRFLALQRAYAECLGIRYGFVVGENTEAGYYFSTSDILRTVDLLLENIGG